MLAIINVHCDILSLTVSSFDPSMYISNDVMTLLTMSPACSSTHLEEERSSRSHRTVNPTVRYSGKESRSQSVLRNVSFADVQFKK